MASVTEHKVNRQLGVYRIDLQKCIKTEYLRKRFLVKKPMIIIKSQVLTTGKVTEKKIPKP